ncbi:hypothetical protein GRF61_14070 [Azoarcus sp. TTM-91]|nr:hypothetical protein [Azoarcus sp. TTM-91]NMG35571.1 hypothetical protein [Azoarcus sp. TTM-91]
MQYDTFSSDTLNQLKQAVNALRELTTPPDPLRQPIGFVTPKNKSKRVKG